MGVTIALALLCFPELWTCPKWLNRVHLDRAPWLPPYDGRPPNILAVEEAQAIHVLVQAVQAASSAIKHKAKTAREVTYQSHDHAIASRAWKKYVRQNARAWRVNADVDRLLADSEWGAFDMCRRNGAHEVSVSFSLCHSCCVQVVFVQIPDLNAVDLESKFVAPLIEAFCDHYFYNPALDAHSAAAREFATFLLRQTLVRYRRTVKATVSRLARAEDAMKRYWTRKFCSHVFVA